MLDLAVASAAMLGGNWICPQALGGESEATEGIAGEASARIDGDSGRTVQPSSRLLWPLHSLVLAATTERAGHTLSLITGFVSAPIFSMSMVTVSPAFNHTGGLRAKPTPCGVPVIITVPGKSVLLLLR